MKLIKMTDYVINHAKHCAEKGKKDGEWDFMASDYDKILNYAKFLNKKLELWMFVSCDEDNNVLEEPKSSLIYKMQLGECSADEMRLNREYQKALDRVLFKGFEVLTNGNRLKSVINREVDFRLDFINSKGEKHTTIENLIPYGIETTKDF